MDENNLPSGALEEGRKESEPGIGSCCKYPCSLNMKIASPLILAVSDARGRTPKNNILAMEQSHKGRVNLARMSSFAVVFMRRWLEWVNRQILDSLYRVHLSVRLS